MRPSCGSKSSALASGVEFTLVPPTTSTVPLWRRAAPAPDLAIPRLPAVEKVCVEGLKSSAAGIEDLCGGERLGVIEAAGKQDLAAG